MSHSDKPTHIRDAFTEVGVTPRCLLRLQLLSGGWVRVSPASTPRHSSAGRSNRRGPQDVHSNAREAERIDRAGQGAKLEGLLCRAVAVTAAGDWTTSGNDEWRRGNEPPLANDEVLIPPSVAFNAGLGPFSVRVVLCRDEPNHGRSSGRWLDNGAVLHRPPPTASTASVSKVKRPRSAGGHAGGGSGGGGGAGGTSTAKQTRAHALALMSFFSTPRVLRVGDVFGVSVPSPGGGGGSDGNGAGCWWQELHGDAGGVSDSEEEDARDAVEQGSDRGAGDARVGSGTAATALSDAGLRDGESNMDGADMVGLEETSRQCGSEGRRFREAIVRQGAELVFFRVTALEAENGGGSGGSRSSAAGSGAALTDEGLVESRFDAKGCCDEMGGMVVSRRATELREGGPVCSAMPELGWYHRFVCRAQGYPCPADTPPLVSFAPFRCLMRTI